MLGSWTGGRGATGEVTVGSDSAGGENEIDDGRTGVGGETAGGKVVVRG